MGRWVLVMLLSIAFDAAAERRTEDSYNREWCARQGGIAEFVLPDRTRVDCVLGEYAIEADFAHKRYQPIGQAAHYARWLDLRPGILIIVRAAWQCRFVQSIKDDAERLRFWMSDGTLVPYRIWVIGHDC